MSSTSVGQLVEPRPKSRSTGKSLERLWANRPLAFGTIIFVAVFVLSVFGPMLYHVDPMAVDTSHRLLGPSSHALLGTDTFGRDVLSRLMQGGRVSMIVGFCTAGISAVVGVFIGLTAAFNKYLDPVLMRMCDGLMAFPSMLLAIALTASLGPTMTNVIVSLSIVFSPVVARVSRSAALSVKQQTYIEVLKSQGASTWEVLVRNVLPNIISPVIVQITFVFADALLVEAALSFMGAGIPAPQPSWGNMLLEGKAVVFTAWWLVVFPGIAIMLTILSANLIGDGLRDLIDPQQHSIPRSVLKALRQISRKNLSRDEG